MVAAPGVLSAGGLLEPTFLRPQLHLLNHSLSTNMRALGKQEGLMPGAYPGGTCAAAEDQVGHCKCCDDGEMYRLKAEGSS